MSSIFEWTSPRRQLHLSVALRYAQCLRQHYETFFLEGPVWTSKENMDFFLTCLGWLGEVIKALVS